MSATPDCYCGGCIGMGPCDAPIPTGECGECALEAQHFGPCAWICSHCQGSGRCPACNGSSDDGSGLDYTCMECGGGSCPYCEEGLVSDEVAL